MVAGRLGIGVPVAGFSDFVKEQLESQPATRGGRMALYGRAAFPVCDGAGEGGCWGGAEYLGEDHWRYPVSSGYERVNLLLTFMVQQDIGLSPDKSFWQHPWKGGG